MEVEAEADALISLPPELLDDILSRLCTRDTVRTSALNRGWRRRWEAVPSLDLYFRRPDEEEGALEDPGAVDGILRRFLGRVRLFVAALDDTNAGRVHDWLRVLSGRDVEILNLSFITDPVVVLPTSVFSCARLIKLILCDCSIPLLPPGFVAFPKLRALVFRNVQLQDQHQLEEIIEASPSLEYLKLTDVSVAAASSSDAKEWVIRAPFLRGLTIVSENNDCWTLKELMSLYSAVVCLSHFFLHPDFAKFLSGLVQVEELLVDMESLYRDEDDTYMMPEILLCTFHNLKRLTIFMCFWQQPPIMLTLCLLKNSPNLEKLKILVTDHEVAWEFEADVDFLNTLWTDGMCANLQVVEMIDIKWHPNEMSFIELILSKARLLQTLSFSYREDVEIDHDALDEILSYETASDEARILF